MVQQHPAESTPLLSKTTIGTGSFDHTTTTGGGDGEEGEGGGGGYARLSFRRKSYAKLSVRQLSSVLLSPDNDEEDNNNNNATATAANTEGAVAVVVPLEGLAPLFYHTGIPSYDGREYIPYRKPSLVKSVPAFPPYRRKARHRSFYLWWTNEFRHWWKSSRLLVRLGGLYVYSFDPMVAPKILLLDPEKRKTIKKLFKFAKKLGQGGQLRIFVKTVKPFTRSMRLLVGAWRWFEAAPCRRDEVGLEEAMAFVGNRVSRIVARGGSDLLGLDIVFPFQRFLFRNDYLPYPEAYHPIAICVCLGIIRAVSPFAASFQGSRLGRVLTRNFFSAAKNRWLPVQRIGDLNLLSDDCQEKDEANQTADLVVIARRVATALGKVQVSGEGTGDGKVVVRQYEALIEEGFHQVGAGSGGYAVYTARFKTTTILLHVTPYGPSITDVMPFYLVLEFETSVDSRQQKWANALPNLSPMQVQGPQVLEGYAYQGAFFSPHHFAELKEMYDKQLAAYEYACKKLPIVSKNTRHGGPPRDLPTLKKFLEAGKRRRKQKKNKREFNELQKVVSSVAKEILASMKKEKKRGEGGDRLAPKGVILYFEGLDCSGKSSTGGLVQAALEQSGYEVGMRQYNRPPTREQRMRPWMDRFEVPGGASSVLDLTPDDDQDGDGEHIGLVWDRGPAGDFVYGNLNELPPEEKKKRYDEFKAFDRECREKDILFLKLFFITNRDSIAKTLGKRLAQKKMAKDLTTWLQACRSRGEVDDVSLEGLEAISAHIDPTDFVAFNCYERNLRIFSNFVMNTDSDTNPWVVVNTGDRYAARKALMSSFREHLHEFQSRGLKCSPCLGPKQYDSAKTDAIGMDEMMKKKFKTSWRHTMIAWITLLALLVLAATYREETNWDRAWFPGPTKYNITALLEDDADDDISEGIDFVKGKRAKAGKQDISVEKPTLDDKEAKAGKKAVSEEEPTPDDNGKETKTGKQAVSEEEHTEEEPIQDNSGVVDGSDEKEAKAGKTLSEEGNADVESEGTE